MNENVQRWHNAYQKALSQSPVGGDGVVRIFEKLVGSPPLPADEEAYEVYLSLLEDLRRMEDFESRYPLATTAFGSARCESFRVPVCPVLSPLNTFRRLSRE